MAQVLPGHEIKDKIYLIRGIQVMVDKDLARLYEVETGALKRSVKRNIARFPEDFMFELNANEVRNLECQVGTSKLENSVKNDETLICQIGISKVENAVENSETRGGNRFSPFVFTEPGVAMLSTVLRSDRAIQVNIAIMRTFIQLRRQRDFQTESLQKFQILEFRLDEMNKRVEQLEGRSKDKSHLEPQNQTKFTNTMPLLELVGPNVPDQVTQIQTQVSEYFHLKMNDLRSQSRGREFVLARQIAIYLIREKLGLGFREIGKYFYGRDHTTILHSYRKIQVEIKRNSAVQRFVSSIQEIIRVSQEKERYLKQ